MQRETKLQSFFFLFVLHQLDVLVPSLDTTKRIKLPGFIPPQIVKCLQTDYSAWSFPPSCISNIIYYILSSIIICSQSGAPFCMKLPTTILKHCYSDPAVSSKIA